MNTSPLSSRMLLIHGIGATTLAALSLTLWSVVISPWLDTQREQRHLETQIADKRAELDRLGTFRQQIGQQIQAANNTIESLHVDIHPASNLNLKLSDLAELANHGGLQVDGINPGQVEQGDRLQVYPLQVSGRGTYTSFADFLRAAKATSPDSSVKSFTLRSEPGSNGKNSCSFTMTLNWCARKDEPQSSVALP